MINTKKLVRQILLCVLMGATFISFFVFSRFTVDDAFISWRYGKNLVEFGVWNYNPSTFDMVQAYTNPIYAFISVVPNLLKVDVVLFFKIISIVVLILFAFWFLARVNRSLFWLLGFVGLPATMVHAFAGLETFLFVFLLGALLISLYEENAFESICLTLLLFVTRPESWLFVVLTPIFLFIRSPKMGLKQAVSSPVGYMRSLEFCVGRGAAAFLVLSFSLAAYFYFHYAHFGDLLPNTFYIKSGAKFSSRNFLFFLSCFAPALFVVASVAKSPKFFVLVVIVFSSMIASYSTSDLQMDYASRFAFHIFAPSYFLFCYFLKDFGDLGALLKVRKFRSPVSLFGKLFVQYAPAVLLFLFFLKSTASGDALYYPRALISHAELGKLINGVSEKYGIRNFSFGDAGMVPYYSRINALDNIGLASSEIGRRGLGREYLDRVNLDMAIFYATPSGIRLNEFNQKIIFDWVSERGFSEICSVYFTSDYLMTVYAKTDIPEIKSLCGVSYMKNTLKDKILFRSELITPPWYYWKE